MKAQPENAPNISFTDEQKWALSDAYIEKVLNPGERSLLVDVKRFFKSQCQRNLKLVSAWETRGGVAHKSRFILPKHSENQHLQQMMVKHYRRQAARAHRLALAQIRAAKKKGVVTKADESPTITEDMTQADIRAIIARRLQEISVVNNTTFKGVERKLADIIAQANEDEISNADLAARIRTAISDVYGGREKYTSLRIARTETGVITSQVQFATGKRVGGMKKGWLSTRDELVRTDHRLADRQGFIPYGETFEAPEMMYPLDPSGDVSEVVNCRCALIFQRDDEDGKSIEEPTWAEAIRNLKR